VRLRAIVTKAARALGHHSEDGIYDELLRTDFVQCELAGGAGNLRVGTINNLLRHMITLTHLLAADSESKAHRPASSMSPPTEMPESVSNKVSIGPNASSISRSPDPGRRRRKPDLEVSRKRLRLVDVLAQELAIIKREIEGYCTADNLKRKYPKFTLWTVIEDSQIMAIVEGEKFTPKAYAENLTLMKFGLTSRETLKKDRRKLRKAQKAGQE